MERSQLRCHFLPSQEVRGTQGEAWLMPASLGFFPSVARTEWEAVSSQSQYVEPQSQDSWQIRLLICTLNKVNSIH